MENNSNNNNTVETNQSEASVVTAGTETGLDVAATSIPGPDIASVETNDPNIVSLEELKQILPEVPEEELKSWIRFGTIFAITFIKEVYVYRNFSYREYKSMRQEIRSEFADRVEEGDEAFKERIQKNCVLWPKDYMQRLDEESINPIPGGIPFILGDYILAASGFADSIEPDIIPLQ